MQTSTQMQLSMAPPDALPISTPARCEPLRDALMLRRWLLPSTQKMASCCCLAPRPDAARPVRMVDPSRKSCKGFHRMSVLAWRLRREHGVRDVCRLQGRAMERWQSAAADEVPIASRRFNPATASRTCRAGAVKSAEEVRWQSRRRPWSRRRMRRRCRWRPLSRRSLRSSGRRPCRCADRAG